MKKELSTRKTVYLIALLTLPLILQAQQLQGEPRILKVKLEGTITAMSAELVEEAINYATSQNIPIILTIDTPGGSLDATFRIIEAIEGSSVPVVGYVYPIGAKAWSAGTFILLSTHVAAMAPHTIIGSAQPVAYTPLGGAAPINDSKTINALVAYITERARLRERNETAARLFVEKNLNLSAEEAKNYKVVEVVAEQIEELLKTLHGLEVELMVGSYRLQTEGAKLVEWSPSIRIWVLRWLSEPIIAYLLFIVGMYALIFGVASPGYGSEVVGLICIVLGLIGLGLAGATIGGLMLIAVGAILLLAELFTPGFGLLGGGGFFCIILGGLLLFPSGPWAVSYEWLRDLLIVVIVVPLAIGSFFVFAAYKVVKARMAKPFITDMVGEVGEALERIPAGGKGFIIYKGEYWMASSEYLINSGQKVKIVGKNGPILKVRPLEEVKPKNSES